MLSRLQIPSRYFQVSIWLAASREISGDASIVPEPLFLAFSRYEKFKCRTMNVPLMFRTQSYRGFFFATVTNLVPDPLVPARADFASLRLYDLYEQSQWSIFSDYHDNTVLGGLTELGGFWSLQSVVFTALFGSSLMFVAFGELMRYIARQKNKFDAYLLQESSQCRYLVSCISSGATGLN